MKGAAYSEGGQNDWHRKVKERRRRGDKSVHQGLQFCVLRWIGPGWAGVYLLSVIRGTDRKRWTKVGDWGDDESVGNKSKGGLEDKEKNEIQGDEEGGENGRKRKKINRRENSERGEGERR